MNKIYHVIIKGKTFESRDLKELIARVVSAKRDLDRKARVQGKFQTQASAENISSSYNQAQSAAVL